MTTTVVLHLQTAIAHYKETIARLESVLASLKPPITPTPLIPPTVRLGYACINETIKKVASANHTCIAKTFELKGVDYAISLARSNLQNVLKIMKWNEVNGIRLYRMSSDMFPQITNPKFMVDGEYAYPLSHFTDELVAIGQFAKTHNHRMTFHPSQYNQVGTPNPSVFKKTVIDLKLHAEIMDLMSLPLDSIIIVHGGGVFGDLAATTKRWIKQFFQLDKCIQRRLVIENCERCYSALDVLAISKAINRPVVFDTHHYDCYNIVNAQKGVAAIPHPSTFMSDIIKSWTSLGLVPKFHISEQNPDKRLGAHSDFVEVIPDYLLEVASHTPIDIMIEAKKKEQAVLRLYKRYGQ